MPEHDSELETSVKSSFCQLGRDASFSRLSNDTTLTSLW